MSRKNTLKNNELRGSASENEPERAGALGPASGVERRAIDALVPFARNARTHSDEQVAQIAASIREWGWTMPVLIDAEGMIIAGHGRVAAARKLGLTHVPVLVADQWSEAQKRAYVLADNKLALNAGWDDQLLAVELSDLQDMGFDPALAGFSAHELAAALGEPAPKTDDDADSPLDEQKQLLLVEATSERELEALYEEMSGRGFKCKVMN